MDIADMISRLKDRVPDLGGRVQGAADLLRLMSSGADPQITPVAFVVPSGISGGAHSGMIGAYVQPIERLFSVVLTLRTDASGLRALERVDALIDAIIAALAGWDIGLTSLFVFKRCQPIRSASGSLSYEISFAVTDRIKKALS
ncbi:MAG: phage tail terminator protein [Cypionkella sp.]